jgi:hypothetical protein
MEKRSSDCDGAEVAMVRGHQGGREAGDGADAGETAHGADTLEGQEPDRRARERAQEGLQRPGL